MPNQILFSLDTFCDFTHSCAAAAAAAAAAITSVISIITAVNSPKSVLSFKSSFTGVGLQ